MNLTCDDDWYLDLQHEGALHPLTRIVDEVISLQVQIDGRDRHGTVSPRSWSRTTDDDTALSYPVPTPRPSALDVWLIIYRIKDGHCYGEAVSSGLKI